MDAAAHPVRSAAGRAELGSRERRLSQRHRTVLFLVDGRRSETEVRTMAALAGVPGTCFGELVGLGLIDFPSPAPVAGVSLQQPDPGLTLPVPETAPADLDSLLPASRTLAPESISADSRFDDRFIADSSRLPPTPGDELGDPVVAEVREILLRAVRSAAPVAGSLTLLRLRRARTRGELTGLLDEVMQRIARPPRSLAATQILRRVHALLEGRFSSPAAS